MRRHLKWALQVAVVAVMVMFLARVGCGRDSTTSQFDPSRRSLDPLALVDELLRRYPALRTPMLIVGGLLVVVVLAVAWHTREQDQ